MSLFVLDVPERTMDVARLVADHDDCWMLLMGTSYVRGA